jgi:hypothetical protein
MLRHALFAYMQDVYLLEVDLLSRGGKNLIRFPVRETDEGMVLSALHSQSDPGDTVLMGCFDDLEVKVIKR